MEKSVFIVDDDDAVLDSIKELVESVGLVAMTYSSPQIFLDVFQPEYSGCLVLDVRMAEMSGLQSGETASDADRLAARRRSAQAG